jgi:L-ribulose-5-phosphate 3-epimerase
MHNNIIKLLIFCALSLFLTTTESLSAKPKAPRYKIGACDWMMLKRQKAGVFALAHSIGADGVEVDMGPLGQRVLFDNQLRDAEAAKNFLHIADSLNVKISSVAMSGFFAQNFITRQNYKDLINDCLNTMRMLGTKVAFMPLGGCGKAWQTKGEEHDVLVKRLHDVGEMALKEGMVIGIRTALNADDDIALLNEINSEGIKIYYNFQDACDNKRDICSEIEKLGIKRICQIHVTNTDSLNLREDPEIDMKKVKKSLDKIGYRGWLIVERSRDYRHTRDVKFNFGNNVAYLKEIFQ